MRNRPTRLIQVLLAITLLIAIRPPHSSARTIAAVERLQAFLSQCDVVVTGTVLKIQPAHDVPSTVICAHSSLPTVTYDHALAVAVDSVRLGGVGAREITLFYTASTATPRVKVNDRVIAGGAYKSADRSQVFGSFTTAREMALGPRDWMRTHTAPWTPVHLDTLGSAVASDSAAHPATLLRHAKLGVYSVQTIASCESGKAMCTVNALKYPGLERGPDIRTLVLGCDRWCPLDVVSGDTLLVPVTGESSIGRLELPGCARSYKVQCGAVPVLGMDLQAALSQGVQAKH